MIRATLVVYRAKWDSVAVSAFNIAIRGLSQATALGPAAGTPPAFHLQHRVRWRDGDSAAPRQPTGTPISRSRSPRSDAATASSRGSHDTHIPVGGARARCRAADRGHTGPISATSFAQPRGRLASAE